MEPEVRVIRSARRRRGCQARVIAHNVVEVRIPDTFTDAQEQEAVSYLVSKIKRRMPRPPRSDAALAERAHRLNSAYLDSRARFRSIRWVSNQNQRWGSCSVLAGDIRISDRLQIVPDYVLDSVIIHELVHTFVPGSHPPEFWQWVHKAPKWQQAEGYLEAYSHFDPAKLRSNQADKA